MSEINFKFVSSMSIRNNRFHSMNGDFKFKKQSTNQKQIE